MAEGALIFGHEKRNTQARPDNGHNVTGRAFKFIPMAITITIVLKGGTSNTDPVMLCADTKENNPSSGEKCMATVIRKAVAAALGELQDSKLINIINRGENSAN